MGVRKVLRSFDKDTLVLQVLENEDYHFLVSVLPQGSNLLPGNGHFPLRPTSQAIDAGNDAVCPRTDQLGQRRIGPCDLGAIGFRDKHDRHHDKDDQPDGDLATTAR